LCAAWLSLAGRLHWLVVATAAAVAATVAAVLSGGVAANHVTPIAFIAAAAGVGVWFALTRAGILLPAS
jgi:hypothetical protein